MSASPALAHTATQAQLEAYLRRVTSALQSLADILNEEASALASSRPDPLLQIIADKRRALQELETLGRDPRLAMCLDPSLAPTGAAAAGQLRADLERCRLINLAAGGAIVTARRDNEQILRLLSHGTTTPAYGARGQTPGVSQSRSLARA
jgi:flagellar biosynthesis/type III secretory pathway chaperone